MDDLVTQRTTVEAMSGTRGDVDRGDPEAETWGEDWWLGVAANPLPPSRPHLTLVR
jgi:hypothetical protein